MQRTIGSLLAIENLPLLEDIQKIIKNAVFDLYVSNVVSLLFEDEDLNISCTHDYQICEKCEEKIIKLNHQDRTIVLAGFLKKLHLSLELSSTSGVVNAIHSLNLDIRRPPKEDVALYGRVYDDEISLHGDVIIYYDNVEMHFYVEKGDDDLWELILHQSKFLQKFYERFQGCSEDEFETESANFVAEFVAL